MNAQGFQLQCHEESRQGPQLHAQLAQRAVPQDMGQSRALSSSLNPGKNFRVTLMPCCSNLNKFWKHMELVQKGEWSCMACISSCSHVCSAKKKLMDSTFPRKAKPIQPVHLCFFAKKRGEVGGG